MIRNDAPAGPTAALVNWLSILGAAFLIGLIGLVAFTGVAGNLGGGDGGQPSVGDAPVGGRPTATATSVPRPAPTATATPRDPDDGATTAERAVCPSVETVSNLAGVPVSRIGEACGFTWKDPNGRVADAVCPDGFICTFAVAEPGGGGLLMVGPRGSRPIFAGTWRLIARYPSVDAVHEPCRLLRNERDYAGSFPIDPDGFSCPGQPLLRPIIESEDGEPENDEPSGETPASQPDAAFCQSIGEGYLEENPVFGDEGASHIVVGYWRPGGPDQRERTVVLAGGRWRRDDGVGGYFWVYSGCTDNEVNVQATAHNERMRERLGDRFAGWGDETSFTRLD